MIDAFGPVSIYPALSMVTGLLANALGYERHETAPIQRLQDRLQMGARVEGKGVMISDFQIAQLQRDDAGWTRAGWVRRRGGEQTFESPHVRLRDYWSCLAVTLALGLQPEDEHPHLADLCEALRYPARPLFLGRKSCLPAAFLVGQHPFVEAADLRTALEPSVTPLIEGEASWVGWQVPDAPADRGQGRSERVFDLRLWEEGPHAGWRDVWVDEQGR